MQPPLPLSRKATIKRMSEEGARYTPKNYIPHDELRRELYQFYKPEELIDAMGAIVLPCGTIRKKDMRPVNVIVKIERRTKDFAIVYPDGRRLWCQNGEFLTTSKGLESIDMILEFIT